MIQIGKGICLNTGKFLFAHKSTKAKGGFGGKFCVKQSCNEGQDSTDSHLHTFYKNIMYISVCHSHIDDVGHDQRDDKFKSGFRDNKENTENKFPPEWPEMRKIRFRSCKIRTPFLIYKDIIAGLGKKITK